MIIPESGATKADLGDSLTAHYDERTKTWVLPGGEDLSENMAKLSPPPTTQEVLARPIQKEKTADATSDPLAALMALPQHLPPCLPGSIDTTSVKLRHIAKEMPEEEFRPLGARVSGSHGEPQTQRTQNGHREWDNDNQRWVEPGSGDDGHVRAPIATGTPLVVAEKNLVQTAEMKRVKTMKQSQQKALEQRKEQKKTEDKEANAFHMKLEPKIIEWSDEHGQTKPLRELIGTLHTILWPEANWKPVHKEDLPGDSQCKRAFHKAMRVVHPDKTHHLDTEKCFLAKQIFDILSRAKIEIDKRAIPATASPKIIKTTRPSLSDQILKLGILQKANGSFALDEKLAFAVGLPWLDALVQLKTAIEAGGQNHLEDDTVFATLCPIAVFRCLFPKNRSIWELQEGKALGYLADSGCCSGGGNDKVKVISCLEFKLLASSQLSVE